MKWDHYPYQTYHHRKKEYVTSQETYTELYHILHFINFDCGYREYRADYKAGRIRSEQSGCRIFATGMVKKLAINKSKIARFYCVT